MPVPLLGRAIRCRHSAVDEERGGRVVARHIYAISVVKTWILSHLTTNYILQIIW